MSHSLIYIILAIASTKENYKHCLPMEANGKGVTSCLLIQFKTRAAIYARIFQVDTTLTY